MKVLALLFLVGCAVATSEFRWQTGKTHVFEYSGRLLNSIPQLASHYSGLGLNATVMIDVISPQKLQLYLTNPRYVNVNQRLEARLSSNDGRDGANWREVYMPPMTEVDQDIKELLKKPIVFEVLRGEIREAKIARIEPEWSVNLKKSLAVLFQAKIDASSYLSEESQRSVSDNFWKTKEQSIDGLCEVTYQVNELPKYMIVDRPELIPQPEQCQEEKYYEIVKTKNVDNCERRSEFSFVQPGHYDCNGPNCKEMWARTSETRYIACGTRGNLMLQTVINQGELNQLLMRYKTERVVSGTLQTLRLKEVKTHTPVPEPQNMTPLKSMMYEYTFKAYKSVQQQIEQEEQHSRIPYEVAKDSEQLAKAIPTLQMSAHKEIPKSKIIEQVKNVIRVLITDLKKPLENNLKERQVSMKIISIARGLAMLKRTEIKSIYNEIKPEIAPLGAGNLIVDALVMSGTPEAVMVLKDLIETELSKPEIVSIFMTLPNTLIFPTEEVLETLFELHKIQKIQDCPITRNVAMMSISTLLEKACLSKHRDIKYPTWVFGKFCTPNSPILMKKWIPHLVKQLESTQHIRIKNEIIVALGMLPHEEIIGKLIPYVEGQVQGMHHVPRITRLLALWSLSTSGMIKPQSVEPIFYSIYANPAEHTELRIAAFNVLIKLNPPMAVFHKIAQRTWNEQDMEVLKVVNSALYTLSQEFWTIQTQKPAVFTLPRKASLVYPLIKKTAAILPTSGSIYTSDKLEKLGAGFEGMTNWIASETSFIPIEMYSEIRYLLGQYHFKPIAFGLRLKGVENIYNKLAEILTPLEAGQSVQQQEQGMLKKVTDSLNSEWKKVIEKLSIESRKSEKLSGSVFLNIFETTPIFGNFAELTVPFLKEKMVKIFENPASLKEKLSQQQEFNVKKAFELTKTHIMIPTDMGLPLIVDIRMPVVLSLEGKTKLVVDWKNPSVLADLKVFANIQYIGEVATINPLNKEYLSAAVDQSIVVSVPSKLKIALNLPEQSLMVQYFHMEGYSKPIDVLHYHVHPFTARQSIEELNPITLAQEKKLIRSPDTLRELKRTFGESLGIHVESEIRTESRYMDLRSVYEKLKMFNYNPVNYFRFVFATYGSDLEGRNSLRRHEYNLKVDPTKTVTKEMKFKASFGYASKSEKSQPLEYKSIKVISESEQKRESEKESHPLKKALKMIVPIQIVSKKAELKSIHAEREEKIVKAMEHLEPSIETAKAFTVKIQTFLIGSRPISKSHYVTAVLGQKQETTEKRMKSEWNIVLESDQLEEKLVLKGNLESPVLSVWDLPEIRNSLIDVRFFQTLQVYRTGTQVPQWSIDVRGNTKVSQEQKEHSMISKEAKLCKSLMQKKSSGEKVLAHLSEPCEAMRLQARTLDEVDLTIKYNKVPKMVETVEHVITDSLKTLLWPFRQVLNEQVSYKRVSINDAPVLVRIVFNKMTPSFDLTIQKPQENIKFRQIRLPSPLRVVFPLKAGVSNAKLIAQKITGHSIRPVCKLEEQTLTLENVLKTYDNKTYPVSIDYCYHLMTADCSQHKSFAVMTRSLKPVSLGKELLVSLEKSKIVLTPTSASASPLIKVNVDGQDITITSEKAQILKSPLSQKKLGLIYRTQNAIYLSIEQGLIIFDGHSIVMESSQVFKGQLCGLCGNQNQQIKDELEGPKKCMHSKPEILAASYRISNLPQSCEQEKPLSPSIKKQLSKEESQCLKEKFIPTKISKSLKTQNGQCTILKHSVVRRPGQICVSKKAVTQCATGCQPIKPEPLLKKISFTCFKEDRVAEHYAKKAERGQKMTELASRPTAFEAEVPQPMSCVPASNYL